MNELLGRIETMLADPVGDRSQVERTLTDGYAHALALEAEGRRLQAQLAILAHDAESHSHELSVIAHRLDGTTAELERLRAVLVRLKQRLG